MENPARQPGCGNVSFVIYMRYMLAIQACIFLYMGHIWKGLVNMYYLATPENSPSTMMAEPYARRLRCLISPELDRANHDIACGTVEIAATRKANYSTACKAAATFVLMTRSTNCILTLQSMCRPLPSTKPITMWAASR